MRSQELREKAEAGRPSQKTKSTPKIHPSIKSVTTPSNLGLGKRGNNLTSKSVIIEGGLHRALTADQKYFFEQASQVYASKALQESNVSPHHSPRRS